jgi:hypothetical protein
LRIERRAHIRDRLQLLVFNRDHFRRILSDGAAVRHDGRDRLAMPAGTLDSDGVLRRRFETLQMREHANPGRNNSGELIACYDGDDSRQPPCLGTVDGDDARMGIWGAQEYHVAHARQFHVANIESASLHQPFEIRAWNHLADIGVRPIKLGEYFGIGGCDGHGRRPARIRAVVSTASIMA